MWSALRWFTALSVLTVSLSCQGPPKGGKKPLVLPTGEVQARAWVNVDNLRLREAPGSESAVIRTLPKDMLLYELGEVSNFNTRIVLRGITFDEPWVRVATPDSLTGWVYAGGLNFDLRHPSELATILVHKRLQSLFGEALTRRIEQYRMQYQAATRSREFAQAYRTGRHLRDSLVAVLEDKIRILDFQMAPDLFWLEGAIPGYIPQIVAEGTQYHLFQNFKDMAPKTEATEGREDDEFIELCFQVYSEDSIEYFFPSWFIQTWDYGGHSLLGRGKHLFILEEMEEILVDNDLFEPEITDIKVSLLRDITSAQNTYWENQENILSELDRILQSNFNILTDSEKELLITRKEMFEDPAEYEIQLNFKSGLHDL